MKPLRVAVWGLGPHALKNILPALVRSPGLQLRGVSSRNRNVVASARERFGCTSWPDAAAMLSDQDVDVVYLSTPIGLHAAQGRAVLEAGHHLWCEKPLAASWEQAAELIGLSRDRSLTLAEGLMYLYHPQFRHLAEMISSGMLGAVQSITCRFGIPTLERPGFRTDPALGGGAFLDVGCYPVSAVLSLLPGADARVELAEVETAPGSRVDTSGRAILRFDAGVTANLEWRTHCAYRNEIDCWGSDASVSTERIFSKAEEYVPRFRVLDRQGREEYREGLAANHFVEMFAAFQHLVAHPDDAEHERRMIARRAQLMERIRVHAEQRRN
jgi:NDP-hexose-3-ketoreductase